MKARKACELSSSSSCFLSEIFLVCFCSRNVTTLLSTRALHPKCWKFWKHDRSLGTGHPCKIISLQLYSLCKAEYMWTASQVSPSNLSKFTFLNLFLQCLPSPSCPKFIFFKLHCCQIGLAWIYF